MRISRVRGRRLVSTALVAVAVAGLGACDTSRGPVDRSIDAPAQTGDVIVRGTLVAPDRRDVVGRQVVASRRKTGGDLLGDLFATVLTGGLAALGCLSSDGPIEACRNGDYTTQTAAGGSFAFRLRATDVTASGGRRRSLDVSTGLAPAAGEVAGPVVSTRVDATSGQTAINLGRLTGWDGGVRASSDGSALRLDWSNPPGTGTVAVDLSDTTRALHISNSQASRPAVLDARLLEDSHPVLTVSAHGRLGGRPAVWVSAGRRVSGPAGVPASRGAACAVAIGERAATPVTPCWLDDGHFGSAPRIVRPTSCSDRPDDVGFTQRVCLRAPITSATLDLGRAIPVSLLVLRASDQVPTTPRTIVIEASTDQQTWTSVGEYDGRPVDNQLEFQPPRGLVARYVRLRADGDPAPQPTYVDENGVPRQDANAQVREFRGDVAAVAELSVWEGRPQPITWSPSDGDTGPHRGIALAVAAGLIALLIGGIGYGLGRRRAPG